MQYMLIKPIVVWDYPCADMLEVFAKGWLVKDYIMKDH